MRGVWAPLGGYPFPCGPTPLAMPMGASASHCVVCKFLQVCRRNSDSNLLELFYNLFNKIRERGLYVVFFVVPFHFSSDFT